MSHAPSDLLNLRHQAVRARLAALDLDALVVTSLPNILYLTNFTGSSAIVIVRPAALEFITDFRYVTAVRAATGTPHQCPGQELVVVEGSYDATLARQLAAGPSARVGFEAAHLTFARHTWWSRSAPTTTLVPTEGVVEGVRLRKDDYEIQTLRQAARRLSDVANGVFTEIRAGRTEQEIATAIDFRLRQGGFSRPAFDTIVAAGPNGALPHACPGERRLTEGDLVVLDFGGVYDSYCVDLTRTVSVGRASDRAREVYGAVREAHDRAISAVRPAASRFHIDLAARETLGRYGLADAFGHGTGHGLGVEVHEDPRIVRLRPDVDTRDEFLERGMVFTIEPGAYLPDWGGVRIEDDVLVTFDGVEVLTDVTTELMEL